MSRTKNPQDRFWEYVDQRGDNDCWLWRGSTNACGYGTYRWEDGSKLAHRLAYVFTIGVIPEGMCVCHHCDTPACCNPKHLFLGTHQDNMHDMAEKGRAKGGTIYGEDHGNAKLTWDDVREIRERYASGNANQPELAKEKNVTQSTISLVVNNIYWHE